MEGYNDHEPVLERNVRELYAVSGRLNLYIHLCRNHHKPAKERMEVEIRAVKALIASIEDEMDSV